jgi:hypothetical protein
MLLTFNYLPQLLGQIIEPKRFLDKPIASPGHDVPRLTIDAVAA